VVVQKITPKGEITLKYLERFSKTETRQLAKMLVKDHPDVFHSMDNARTAIRYYRGAIGKRNRRAATRPILPTPPRPELPASDAPDWKSYELPKIKAKYLVMADTHIPYHKPEAIKIMVTYAKEAGCNGIIILGDFIDCYQLSRFEKSPKMRSFPDEVKVAQQILDYLSYELKPKTFIYKLGNHEERLEHYIYRHAPALFGIEGLTWSELIDRPKITIVKDKRPITCGRLFLIHGHEYSKNMLSPVNPARGIFLRGHECAICAHSHVASNHSEPTFAERIISCWSIGCSCDLHPTYCPMSRWTQGFGVLETKKSKTIPEDNLLWEFSNYKILKGRVVPA